MTETTPAATPWATLADLQASGWKDRPGDNTLCQHLLDVAQEQLEEYAPRLVAGAPIPKRYQRAVLLQAREVWAASTRDSGTDTIGVEGLVVRVRPLSSAVRQLLRPPTALGPTA